MPGDLKLGIITEHGKLIVLPNILETDTVRNVRQQLALLRNVPLQNITLIFEGRPLDDNTSIRNIEGFNEKIDNVPGASNPVESENMARFKCFNAPISLGFKITEDPDKLIVLPNILLDSATVGSIRKQLAEIRRVTTEEITLEFNGVLLNDDTMLIRNIPKLNLNKSGVPSSATEKDRQDSLESTQFMCSKSAPKAEAKSSLTSEPPSKMTLAIKTDSGKLIVLPNILDTHTVKEVQEQVAKLRLSSPEQITLKFNNILLNDNMILRDIPGFDKVKDNAPGSDTQENRERSEKMARFMSFKGPAPLSAPGRVGILPPPSTTQRPEQQQETQSPESNLIKSKKT